MYSFSRIWVVQWSVYSNYSWFIHLRMDGFSQSPVGSGSTQPSCVTGLIRQGSYSLGIVFATLRLYHMTKSIWSDHLNSVKSTNMGNFSFSPIWKKIELIVDWTSRPTKWTKSTFYLKTLFVLYFQYWPEKTADPPNWWS